MEGETERGKDMGDKARGKCEKRKERSRFLHSHFFSFIRSMHALALHTACCSEIIYLVACAGKHGKCGHTKASQCLPGAFFRGQRVCIPVFVHDTDE